MTGLRDIARLHVVKDSIIDPILDRYGTRRVDEALLRELDRTVEETSRIRTAFRLTPYQDKETSGIDASLEWIRALYQVGERFSFELWHDDQTEFIVTVDRELAERFQEISSVFFRNMHATQIGELFPSIDVNDHVSGASFALKNDQFLQIRNFRGVTEMTRDPYEDIVVEMEALPDDVRIVLQATFVPAEEEWTSRIFIPVLSPIYDRLSGLGKGVPFRPTEYASRDLGELAEDQPLVSEYLTEQEEDRAFLAAIRVFAIASDGSTARASAERIARTVAEQFDDDAMHQGLKHRGIGRFGIKDFLTEAVRRTFDTRRELIGKYKRKPMVLTIPELATVAHIPTTLEHDRFQFDAQSIEWAETGAMESGPDDEDELPESVSEIMEG